MNSKIQQLIQEAGLSANVDQAAIEKFALLLVRACADAADNCPRSCSYTGDYVVESLDYSCSDRIVSE